MEGALPGLLRSFRLRSRLTLGGLAARSGVSKGTLSRWESGVSRPRLAELGMALDALGVDGRERASALAELATPESMRLLRLEDAPPPATGDLVRALRLRRGLTQADSARLVGVAQSALARWEAGQSEPSAATRHALAFALGALPEEAVALVSGTFDLGDDRGWTPQLHVDRVSLTQVTLRHHPLRELRQLGAALAAWRRHRETGDAGYLRAYGHALAFQALSHAEDGHLTRALTEVQAYRRLPRAPEPGPVADQYTAYAESVVLRAKGRREAGLAALAHEPSHGLDVRAWFASERATIVEGLDPELGLRLSRRAFDRSLLAREEDPRRDVDVFYRSHDLGAALARRGRLGEALETFERGGEVYGGLASMLASDLPDVAAYSVQHLLRLAEARLDAGGREVAAETLATARARIGTMPHLQGHLRSCVRLETRLQYEALRVRA